MSPARNWPVRRGEETGRPLGVAAKKQNKLKKSEIAPNLAQIRETLELGEEVPVIPFSAEKGTGREELLGVILSAAAGQNG